MPYWASTLRRRQRITTRSQMARRVFSGRRHSGVLSGQIINRKGTPAGRGAGEPRPRRSRRDRSQVENARSVARNRRRTTNVRFPDNGCRIEHSTKLWPELAVARTRNSAPRSLFRDLAERSRFPPIEEAVRVRPSFFAPRRTFATEVAYLKQACRLRIRNYFANTGRRSSDPRLIRCGRPIAQSGSRAR